MIRMSVRGCRSVAPFDRSTIQFSVRGRGGLGISGSDLGAGRDSDETVWRPNLCFVCKQRNTTYTIFVRYSTTRTYGQYFLSFYLLTANLQRWVGYL